MPPQVEIGHRLVPCLIDQIAYNQPDRTWASVPVHDDNLAKGFKPISFRTFANAINLASRWLTGNLRYGAERFETIAYAGPKDLRYPIIAVAAAKCKKKLLLCSPTASSAAQNHLLSLTKCTTYMHDRSFESLVHTVIGPRSQIRTIQVPEIDVWLLGEETDPIPFEETWEKASADPWIIFHTSGTTGLPKPVIYTHSMMTSFDAAEIMPDKPAMTMNDLFRNQRYYVSMPTLHFVGMTSTLQWTIFVDIVLVAGPPGNVNSKQLLEILMYGDVQSAILTPNQIEDICQEPGGLAVLRKLNTVWFAGAPIASHTAKKLIGHCRVFPAMGSTEGGGYITCVRDEDDEWEYYSFRPALGAEYHKRTNDLYELVFHKRPELARWQQIFQVYPDLDEFATKDLWSPHPTKPDRWRYVGRTDDFVLLSFGDGLFTTDLETTIQQHPAVKRAAIGGEKRPKPFVLIDLHSRIDLDESERETKVQAIWPFVEKANEQCAECVQLSKEMILFTGPARPLPLTAKETVLKRAAFELYQPDIDQLYAKS